MLQRLQNPKAGAVIGALLIVIGGVIDVSGAASTGAVVAVVGFLFILKYRILPARRRRND